MNKPEDTIPFFSILISTYNRAKFLPRAIRSIKKQLYTNWELILVNDGGEDVSHIVKSFFDKRIKLVNLEENVGKSAAINISFESSKGQYIAYLDDDDEWLPNHLQIHYEFINKNPNSMFSHSNACRVVLEKDRYGGEKELSRHLIYCNAVSFEDLITHNRITWLSAVHNRECFKSVGGLDERLRTLEDFDLWRRMSMLYPLNHIPVHTANYYIHQQVDKQLTGLVVKDPIKFHASSVLIQRKSVPPELKDKYNVELLSARTEAYEKFLLARAEQFKMDGNENRYHTALSLSKKIAERRRELLAGKKYS